MTAVDSGAPARVFIAVDGDIQQEVAGVMHINEVASGVQRMAAARDPMLAGTGARGSGVPWRVSAQGVVNPLEPMTWLIAIGIVVVLVGIILYVVWRRRWRQNELPPLPPTSSPPDDRPPAA